MSADPAYSGWLYAKTGVPSGQPTGPVSWEELLSLARAGGLSPADLVWNQSLPQWLPAGQIPGLLPAQPAAQAPGTAWPAARSAFPLVADPLTGRMILFGGRNDESGLDDTWTLGG